MSNGSRAKARVAAATRPHRSRRIGLGQHPRELLAADPRDQVSLAFLSRGTPRRLRDDSVADAVSVLVVDRLELVDVEHDETEFATMTLRAL
jgi:hypothetical protein